MLEYESANPEEMDRVHKEIVNVKKKRQECDLLLAKIGTKRELISNILHELHFEAHQVFQRV